MQLNNSPVSERFWLRWIERFPAFCFSTFSSSGCFSAGYSSGICSSAPPLMPAVLARLLIPLGKILPGHVGQQKAPTSSKIRKGHGVFRIEQHRMCSKPESVLARSFLVVVNTMLLCKALFWKSSTLKSHKENLVCQWNSFGYEQQSFLAISLSF